MFPRNEAGDQLFSFSLWEKVGMRAIGRAGFPHPNPGLLKITDVAPIFFIPLCSAAGCLGLDVLLWFAALSKNKSGAKCIVSDFQIDSIPWPDGKTPRIAGFDLLLWNKTG
jgi:hypothetical protein